MLPRLALFAAASVLLAACRPVASPPVDAEAVRIATACTAACATLRAHECPEGAPSRRRAVSCEKVCINVEATPGMSFLASCLATAKSLPAIRACGVECLGGAP